MKKFRRDWSKLAERLQEFSKHPFCWGNETNVIPWWNAIDLCKEWYKGGEKKRKKVEKNKRSEVAEEAYRILFEGNFFNQVRCADLPHCEKTFKVAIMEAFKEAYGV